jgi:hypothetical protein
MEAIKIARLMPGADNPCMLPFDIDIDLTLPAQSRKWFMQHESCFKPADEHEQGHAHWKCLVDGRAIRYQHGHWQSARLTDSVTEMRESEDRVRARIKPR